MILLSFAINFQNLHQWLLSTYSFFFSTPGTVAVWISEGSKAFNANISLVMLACIVITCSSGFQLEIYTPSPLFFPTNKSSAQLNLGILSATPMDLDPSFIGLQIFGLIGGLFQRYSGLEHHLIDTSNSLILPKESVQKKIGPSWNINFIYYYIILYIFKDFCFK